MSPVNHDPSGETPEPAGRPLTRRELRARERYLETQQQLLVPLPASEVPETPDFGEPFAFPDAAEHPEPVPPARQPDPVGHHAPAADAETAADPAPATSAVPAVPAHRPVVPPQPVNEPVVDDEPAAKVEAALHAEPAAHDEHPEPAADPELPVHQDAAGEPAGHAHSAYDGLSADDSHEAHEAHPGEPAYAYEDQHHGHYDGAHHVGAAHHHGGYADFHEEVHHDETEPHPVLAAVEPEPKASKKVRRRRRGLALFLTFAVFVAAVALGAQFLKPLLGMDRVTDYPGPGTGSVSVTVMPGAGPKQVADQLQSEGIVADSATFLQAFSASGGELSPGDFTFRKEMKNSDAVAVLVDKGAGVIYFALSAGLRINESLDAIAQGSGIPVDQLKALSNSPGQFGVPAKAKNLEGFLAPGEYRFPLGTSAKDILQKLVTGTMDELKAQGITDPTKQYQAIIVASIVQAEGGQADYRNVAGAIYNRLKPSNKETNGLIQSDATVTYGLGTKTFHLTDEQKADKGNPYNTYAIAGLPVGPIGSPGKTAIDAAAKPAANNYLYWVTINLDTKETKFSSTLAEHNKYVELYTAWCTDNPGRCV
ncbi:endolytic transglycosylase MltG [Arthrobacter celericrescens]|uniref:endolytic transglycosylase MltG n=1 Tax=Arthrobacter celericrescens TaxID=2320851 RepID=UPI001968EE15|nr:endolytic transglycosylase MltG [Arthrobacter celericrescens]